MNERLNWQNTLFFVFLPKNEVVGSKNKLKRFKENETFANVLQPKRDDLLSEQFHFKGKWHSEYFKNDNPIVLELGCGKGEYSVGLAKRYPNKNFIGIDIKGARFWRGAKTAIEENINNVAFLRAQIELIEHCFAQGEVSEIWITFPDPQIKYKRTKHRLTNTEFLNRYKSILATNGYIHLKTDSEFMHGYTLGVLHGLGYNVLYEVTRKSSKLDNVLYDIRGPIMDAARQMEEEGQKIIKLNIGNLAPFGFDAPEEIQQDMIRNLPDSAGYSDSKGIFAARKAVMHYTQQQGIKGVTLDDIYLGNGASDLIVMALNALMNEGDELLLPAPDYPLWTAATSLSGGTPVHYLCDEANGWMPDLQDIRSKITPRTKGIVVINPNNPTGALYSDELLRGIVDLAREHELIVLADEVYDKVLYDGLRHTALASLSTDVLTLTFNSLSKAYRSCGYRAGWMVVSGNKEAARDYIEGLDMLANMRLCANVPGQWAVQTALGGYQSINQLICEGGRLRRQRDLAYELITAIPGVTCVKPQAALYMFPRLDPAIYPIEDDRQFFLDVLRATRVMLVQGSGFNYPDNQHFRIVFLPHEDELREAISRLADFLAQWRKKHGTD